MTLHSFIHCHKFKTPVIARKARQATCHPEAKPKDLPFPSVIARSGATRQSTLFSKLLWIASHTLAMTIVAFFVLAPTTASAATPIPFTVTMSEPVTIGSCTGTSCPYLALTVDADATKRAYCPVVTNSATITCTYTPSAGELDLDGITFVDLDLHNNSIAITDQRGNPVTNFAFTAPANMNTTTSSVKLDYPSLSMDFINSDYILSGNHHATLPLFLAAASGTFTRATPATYFDSSGVMQTASSGTPRFDYDPVTHAAKGILMEEIRTNIAPYSETNFIFNNTIQQVGGTYIGKVFQRSTASGGASTLHQTYAANVATAQTGSTVYTISVFCKMVTQRYAQLSASSSVGGLTSYANFDLQTGAIGNKGSSVIKAVATDVGGGVYRLSLSYTTMASPVIATPVKLIHITSLTSPVNELNSETASFDFIGMQSEAGTHPTSYIPTSGAAVTRNQDFITVPTGSWTSSTQGALMAQYIIPYLNSSYPGAVSLESAAANSISLFMNDNSSDEKSSEIFVGGSNVFSSQVSTYTAGATEKSAIYFDATSARAAFDGTLGALDTSVSIPPLTTLRVGGGRGAWFPLNGWVQKVKYYPIKTTDAQIQLLTQ